MEYVVIVHQHLGPRYVSAEVDGGAPLGRTVRRFGRTAFLVAYLGVTLAVVAVLQRHAAATVYTVVVLTLGGMHVLYDAFIWKRPAAGRGGTLAAARAGQDLNVAAPPR